MSERNRDEQGGPHRADTVILIFYYAEDRRANNNRGLDIDMLAS